MVAVSFYGSYNMLEGDWSMFESYLGLVQYVREHSTDKEEIARIEEVCNFLLLFQSFINFFRAVSFFDACKRYFRIYFKIKKIFRKRKGTVYKYGCIPSTTGCLIGKA